MIKSKVGSLIASLAICLSLMNCKIGDRGTTHNFDDFNKTIKVDNWQFSLAVENQNKAKKLDDSILNDQYLKATVYLSNAKTEKSLLYSISDNADDYEAKYKYLSFGSKDDLYIKHKDEIIYPIGYVFEPSNGLSSSERLVYKFQIKDSVFKNLMQDNEAVEYWYVDRLIGLGKICFTHNK